MAVRFTDLRPVSGDVAAPMISCIQALAEKPPVIHKSEGSDVIFNSPFRWTTSNRSRLMALTVGQTVKLSGYNVDRQVALAQSLAPDRVFALWRCGKATWVVERVQ